MSLYDSASDNSNIKAIAAIGGRPIWLTIALVITVIYALASLTQLVVEHQKGKVRDAEFAAKMQDSNNNLRNLGVDTSELDAIQANIEASHKERERDLPIRIAVHGMLIIVSAIYVIKPITAMGLASAAIWGVSLLSLCSYIFKMNIAAADYFFILPDLGIGNIGEVGAVAQLVIPIAILLFSAIKYRPAPKT
jgi:hypothetical protein